MAAKKKPVVEEQGEMAGVMLWKATRPMTLIEHEQLAAKLKIEQDSTGVKIMLVPYSVEAVMADGTK